MSTFSVVARPGGHGPAGLAPGHLRYEQVTALAGRSGILACGSIASCLIVLWTFWRSGPHHYMVGLLVFLVAVHSLAVIGSRIWLEKGRQATTQRMVRVRTVITAIIATAWSTVPLVLMPAATMDQRQLLVYIFAGLVSSSILLAPVLPIALLFAGITSLGLLLPMPLLHHTITEQHALLIMLYFVMTCGVVLHQSRDFSRRVLNELTLLEQADIIGLLLRDFEENASDWLWEIDADLRLHRISERQARVLDSTQNRLDGVSLPELIIQDSLLQDGDKHDGIKLLRCLADRLPFRDLRVLALFEGRTYWFSLTGKPVTDNEGVFAGYRGVGSDITAIRKSNERIAYLARYDSLTGLPNRTLFQESLNQACAQATPFVLMCLDLDGFKSVNDTLGHSTGDALLIAVAGRLRSCLRDGDVVARLGGDEFAVLQAGGDATTAAVLAQRLIRRVTEPYQLDKVQTSIGMSIGIIFSADTGTVPEDLLRGADLALYHSKAEGRGTWHMFEPAMAVRAQQRHTLQTDLRHAIDGGELTLDFQPILDIASSQVIGAEALVRWLHPVRGRISPADFIPVAEESGLIVDLGAWVLRRACREAASWANGARVAVNLSPLQFRDPDLLALIDTVLSETGLPPQRLELEITESVFLEAADKTIACLHALRARGIHIALDDFGTGYSSLSYLRSFPFDKVKIDQSFIRDLSMNDDAIAIVQAIVGMASSLGMCTTGEGVETTAQAELLQSTGCSQVQGYLFGRPCSAQAIADIMAGAGALLSTQQDPVGRVMAERESHAQEMA